ncbi:hypothetical protein ACQY0O_006217 [Thecaphora frezii]
MSVHPPLSSVAASSSSSLRPVLIVVMGTSGSGKSTLGSQLGKALSIPFIDGDDLHPASNVEKMSRGVPLNDDDREPWLLKIRHAALQLTNPASHHIARGLTKGEHKQEILKKFLDVDEGEIQHLRKLAEVYETSALDVAASAEASGDKSETKFLDASEHPPADAGAHRHQGRRGCIIACSALKRSYRQLLRGNIATLAEYDAAYPHHAERTTPPDLDVYHVYMDISPDTLWKRMQARQNHFMKFDMLKSQLETLQVPVDSSAAQNGAQGNEQAQAAEPGIVVVPVEEETSIDEVTRRTRQMIDAVVGRLV